MTVTAQKSMAPQNLRDLYRDDYVASYHDRDGGRLERLLPLMRLDAHMIVADFACGNGLLLELVHDRVRRYHGVDFSSEFIATAKKKQNSLGIGNADFHCRSIADFCAEHPGMFDAAFAMDFAEHVYDNDFLAAARAIRNSLKPGGHFYLHTPNASFLLEILKDRGVLRQFPEHIAVRTAEKTVALLESAGFGEAEVTFLPHYLKSLSWLHWFAAIPLLGRFLRARIFISCRNDRPRGAAPEEKADEAIP